MTEETKTKREIKLPFVVVEETKTKREIKLPFVVVVTTKINGKLVVAGTRLEKADEKLLDQGLVKKV